MNQNAMQMDMIASDKFDESRVTPKLVTDITWISHNVLRNVLRQCGLALDEFIAADLTKLEDWNFDSALTVEFCSTFSAGMNRCAESTEALLSLASLLDQRHASAEHLRAVLPHWLINSNALACLLLGRALLRGKDHEKGIIVLQQGLSIEPTSGSIHRELGLALRSQHQTNSSTPHLEASLGLRGGLRFGDSSNPYTPMLVTRPSPRIDIYFYKQQFYLVERTPGTVGPTARVIGGELFIIRKNAFYRLARYLLRPPPAQWLLGRIREHRMSSAALTQGRDEQPVSSLNFKAVIVVWLRVVLQKIALLMFADTIPKRTESILDAIELARGHTTESAVEDQTKSS